MSSQNLTHKEVAIAATKFIKNFFGCDLAAWEFSGGYQDEQCDGYCLNRRGSHVIEAKVSRADFLADRKKPHRADPANSVGQYKFYAVPETPGIIKEGEIPQNWGLIYVDAKKRCSLFWNMPPKVRQERQQKLQECIRWGWQSRSYLKRRYYCDWFYEDHPKFKTDPRKEYLFLYYLARRYKSGKFSNNIL